MIRAFIVLVLVTRGLPSSAGPASYGSSSAADTASNGVSRSPAVGSGYGSPASTYSSGRLAVGRVSANYATAPIGSSAPAGTKVTSLYATPQAPANSTISNNAASSPKIPSGYARFPVIGTFATAPDGYGPDPAALTDFLASYGPAPPFGAVDQSAFIGYANAAGVPRFDASYANPPAVQKFDATYANAPAVANFDTSYANAPSVPKYDTSYTNSQTVPKYDTSYTNSPALPTSYPSASAVARFDTRTSYPATPATATVTPAPVASPVGSPAVSKLTPNYSAAPAVSTTAHASPVPTHAPYPAPGDIIGARLVPSGPTGKPVAEPVYAAPVAAPGVPSVQPVPVFATPSFPHQSVPVLSFYPGEPAYYGYGVGDLGYGVGHYDYGYGLIGYGLNYGYGLGTPVQYNALLRKK